MRDLRKLVFRVVAFPYVLWSSDVTSGLALLYQPFAFLFLQFPKETRLQLLKT